MKFGLTCAGSVEEYYAMLKQYFDIEIEGEFVR